MYVFSYTDFCAGAHVIHKHFLKKAIDPPDVAAMDTAWATLENLGAVDETGRLTALGRHIVSPYFASPVHSTDCNTVITSNRLTIG